MGSSPTSCNSAQVTQTQVPARGPFLILFPLCSPIYITFCSCFVINTNRQSIWHASSNKKANLDTQWQRWAILTLEVHCPTELNSNSIQIITSMLGQDQFLMHRVLHDHNFLKYRVLHCFQLFVKS